MSALSPADVAKYVDHTLLRATATVAEIETLCEEADHFGFASACINPYFVPLAAGYLVNSSARVCTVVGFPLGATSEKAKAFEARQAAMDGAEEVDMVLNVAALKSGRLDDARSDIQAVVKATGSGVCTKVILEVCYLTDDEIKRACELSLSAGADFVKTSTGFGTGGATLNAVGIMKAAVGDRMEIKASGGIRDFQTAKAMIEAGATRLGTSSGVEIVSGKSGADAY